MTAVVDPLSSVVRVVPARTGVFFGTSMRAGFIYTVAGTGRPGLSGDGGPGTQAALGVPGSVGYLLVERAGSFYGKVAHAGDVYTVALSTTIDPLGDGGPATNAVFEANGLAVQPGTGNLLIADGLTNRVRSVSR